ncbi:baseplate wedge subunit [Vibrio phage vB_VmeM-32]|nr:baseplate wedge subunit [Vibrio phage vB_VmeM-32]
MANINKSEIPQIFDGKTFFELKEQFKQFLSQTDEFKDYNFSGSRLNVLLDLVAYTLLYNQHTGQAALKESFLRLANLRSSVVQHAQDNGYFPSGYTCAKNDVIITSTYSPVEQSPISITIPRGTQFSASVGGVDFYEFVTWEDVTTIRGNNNKYVSQLKLLQGKILRYDMIYQPDEPIIIRDQFIDRDYIRVTVDGAQWTNWTNKPIVSIDSTSTVYYLREMLDGNIELYFGEGASEIMTDGSLKSNFIGGLKPATGARIVIEFLSTDGQQANGTKNFEYVDTIPNVVVESVLENIDDSRDYVGSIGGGEPEDIERIRNNAELMRETQRRAVTPTDYEVFVDSKFGSIVQAVQCHTDPEKPGYAFIAIKPKDGLYLTTVQKEDIQNYLRQYNLATITPIVHSPKYLFVKSKTNVTYSLNDLAKTEEWLRGKVLDSIDEYYTNEVEMFGKGFFLSKMHGYVDDSDISILGTQSTIELVRESDNFIKTGSIGINFLNEFQSRSVNSSAIVYNDEYDVFYTSTDATKDEDNGVGRVLIGPFKSGDIVAPAYTGNDFDRKTIDGRSLYYDVGEVNYFTNTIHYDLNVLNTDLSKFVAAYIEIYCKPVRDNIFANSGTMIVFENDLRPYYTEINMIPIYR